MENEHGDFSKHVVAWRRSWKNVLFFEFSMYVSRFNIFISFFSMKLMWEFPLLQRTQILDVRNENIVFELDWLQEVIWKRILMLPIGNKAAAYFAAASITWRHNLIIIVIFIAGTSSQIHLFVIVIWHGLPNGWGRNN